MPKAQICHSYLPFLKPLFNSEVAGSSLMAQKVKSLPAIQETGVQSLSQEDPLEKEMEAHSSILIWKIPWMESPSGLLSMGSQRVRHD